MIQQALLLGLVVLGFLDKAWGLIIPGALALMLLSIIGGGRQISRKLQMIGTATFLARLPVVVVVSLLFSAIAFSAGKLAGWIFFAISRAIGAS